MERIARVVVLVLVLAGVVFGGIAVAGGYRGSTKPGKGCGDMHHTHYREHECKPPHGGDGGGNGHGPGRGKDHGPVFGHH
jgi:hypothetical protein